MTTSFISYKHLGEHAYKEKVSILRQVLGSLCTNVFFDEEDLYSGDHLPNELRSEIQNADIFVAIITPEYSLSDWCVMEYNHAITTEKRIIPVVICDSSKTPEPIKAIKYLEFNSPKEIASELEEAIKVQKPISPNRPRLPHPGSPEPRIVALKYVIDLADALRIHLTNSNKFDQHAYTIYQFLFMLSDVIQDTAIDEVSGRPVLEVHVQHFVYNNPPLHQQINQVDKVIMRSQQIISETRI